LSLSDEDSKKFVSDWQVWETAEKIVTEAMDEVGVPYESVRGEAAFYGPKIDFQIVNVVGREETASTNQLDMIQPERFDLSYVGADNEHHRPVILHRAPLGTHERFCAFLIEHYGGAFPTWLSPVQVRVLPVAPVFNEYAQGLRNALRSHFIRAEVDDSHQSFGKKNPQWRDCKNPEFVDCGGKRTGNASGHLEKIWRARATNPGI
jgi:threonyl-tRNA synthetase